MFPRGWAWRFVFQNPIMDQSFGSGRLRWAAIVDPLRRRNRYYRYMCPNRSRVSRPRWVFDFRRGEPVT